MLVIFLAAAVSSRNNKAVSHNKPVVAGVVGGLNAPRRAGVGGWGGYVWMRGKKNSTGYSECRCSGRFSSEVTFSICIPLFIHESLIVNELSALHVFVKINK